MGSLTRDEIVNKGQLRAGRDDLNTVLNSDLNDFLDRQGRSWVWPLLTSRRTSLAVPANAASLLLGNGSGGVTPRVTRVLSQPWLYDTLRQTRKRLPFAQLTDEPVDVLALPTARGTPDFVTLEVPNQDQVRFVFNVMTDKAYIMAVPLQELPARLTLGSQVPWYPEDETMLQFIEAETLRREQGVQSPEYQAALGVLSDLIATDKVRHGNNQSSTSNLSLDTDVFR